MFRSILVPIDGSPDSEHALAEAVDFARSSGASLTVMTSVPDASAWILSGAGMGGVDLGELQRESEAQYSAMIEKAIVPVADGLSIDTVLAHGAPGPAIVAQVERGGHDLVIMGSRGRGNVASMLMGSVSQHVLQSGAAAVLVVRA